MTLVPDTLSAAVNKYASFECRMRPGDTCTIPFQGGYYLHSHANGLLVFAAFENGSKQPAVTHSVPVTMGYMPFQAKLIYHVGLTATTVNFQGFLETTDGQILASGKPHDFPIYR